MTNPWQVWTRVQHLRGFCISLSMPPLVVTACFEPYKGRESCAGYFGLLRSVVCSSWFVRATTSSNDCKGHEWCVRTVVRDRHRTWRSRALDLAIQRTDPGQARGFPGFLKVPDIVRVMRYHGILWQTCERFLAGPSSAIWESHVARFGYSSRLRLTLSCQSILRLLKWSIHRKMRAITENVVARYTEKELAISKARPQRENQRETPEVEEQKFDKYFIFAVRKRHNAIGIRTGILPPASCHGHRGLLGRVVKGSRSLRWSDFFSKDKSSPFYWVGWWKAHGHCDDRIIFERQVVTVQRHQGNFNSIFSLQLSSPASGAHRKVVVVTKR